MVRDTRKIHDSEPRGLSNFFGSTDQEAFSMVISFANEHVEIKPKNLTRAIGFDPNLLDQRRH